MAYFYDNYGLVVSNQPERLQMAFGVLTGLFDWVYLITNTRKTVSMACHPCKVPGQMSLGAYKRRTTGTGPTFWEQQWRIMDCPKCGVEVTVGLLLTHRQIQNDVGLVGPGIPPPPSPPRKAQTYRVSFPKCLLRLRCTVKWHLIVASDRTMLRVHFAHRHAQDTIVILEDRKQTYPKCP